MQAVVVIIVVVVVRPRICKKCNIDIYHNTLCVYRQSDIYHNTLRVYKQSDIYHNTLRVYKQSDIYHNTLRVYKQSDIYHNTLRVYKQSDIYHNTLRVYKQSDIYHNTLRVYKQSDIYHNTLRVYKQSDIYHDTLCVYKQSDITVTLKKIRGRIETDMNVQVNPPCSYKNRSVFTLLQRHFELVCNIVKMFPKLWFVLDHMAKPDIKNRHNVAEWKDSMAELAKNKNVYCKLSGMITEADHECWTVDDLKPFVE
ncbi:hypothetical protein QZH41_015711, partial [Actinostola sp. cb2023]